MNSPRKAESAMTVPEVVVMIAIILVLAFVSLPVYENMNLKSQGTKALSNAKQIALALRLYADDNAGAFPSFTLHDGKPTTTPVADSNAAFEQLFPTYVQDPRIFWIPGSAICNATPPADPLSYKDRILQNPGENEWAYVPGLNDQSNPALPLIGSGFADPVSHTYSADQNQKGGAWIGTHAVIVHVDSSGTFAKVDQSTMTVTGPNGVGTTGDIFTTSHGGNGWLKPENTVVNPK